MRKRQPSASWFKIAALALSNIDKCPRLILNPDFKNEIENLQNNILPSMSVLHDGISIFSESSSFNRDLMSIMIWGDAASSKIHRIISGDMATTPEEVKNIEEGVRYIKNEIHPILRALVDKDYYSRIHKSYHTQPRALYYGILSININESLIEKIKKISKKPFKTPYREIDITKTLESVNNSIYNVSDKKAHTLIVIRELIQNAVDACVKKKNQDGLEASVHLEIHYTPVKKEQLRSGGSTFDLCDITCYDSGVGMSWDTVRTKFYTLYSSGKDTDIGATGGYGLAKAAIQNTPIHGWVLESNGHASSKSTKSLTFATQGEQEPVPLRTEHPCALSNGTSITLFGVVAPDTWDVQQLLKRYSVGTGVKIYLNDSLIVPLFNIEDFTTISNSARGFLESATQSYPDEVRHILQFDVGFDLSEEKDETFFSSQGFSSGVKKYTYDNGKYVSVKLLTKPLPKENNYNAVSKPFVLLNGQFQYEMKTYINNLALIVSVETNIRPTESHYPVTQGRDDLVQEFSSDIEPIVLKIKEICTKISESDVLKKGTITNILNKDLPGMSISNMQTIRDEFDFKLNSIFNKISGNTDQEQIPVSALLSQMQSSDNSRNDGLANLIMTIYKANSSRFITREELEELYIQAGTPTAISVEREFISNELVNKNKNNWLTISLLWSFTLQTLMSALSGYIKRSKPDIASKSLIPGVIISKQALGLYVPENAQKNQSAQVLINPIMVVGILYNNLSSRASGGERITREEFDNTSPENEELLAIEIFNTGVHEITHFFYPDSYGGNTLFHENITHLQNRCHKFYSQILVKVNQIMPRLKDDCFGILSMMSENHSIRTQNTNN
jgi:hypothetical protein